nr:integrase, catalytic region, zinc finger, CCHC-type, peptidase aspartic, catalytic [Tanacetum cinerariifolium]
MEAGSKDRPPMLAPDMEILISKGSPDTRTESQMETYKTVSQDIRDQLNAEAEAHQNEVNEIRAERIARVANPLALVAQQQPVYNPQTHPTYYTQNSSTRSQQAATRNRGKAIKIYKPTNNNLRTSLNTSRANQDNSPRINRSIGYENQRIGNVPRARETVGSTMVQNTRIQCYNYKEFGHVARECQKPKRAKDATYHREKMLLYQELEAHYMYMAQLQEVSPDAADSGPIFDAEPLQKVSYDDHYNVFAIESEHPEQSESDHDTYPIEQDAHNVIIDSLDMSYDREEIDQNNDDNDLAKEQLARRNSVEYASKVEIDCAKARGDLTSYKIESQNSFNKYTQTINDLNQTISKMKNKLSPRQETISILSQQKEAQIKLYKTREDQELDKVIALENKVKVLDNIVYKTGQSIQMMNMLNNKCLTSFAKPEFIKKAQRANPRLYDIGCYNDNLALMLTPESDDVIHLEKESRSKLSDLIRPFDYDKLNNLYDLFVPQRKKSSEQRYFSERSRLTHTPVNNGNSKDSFHKQTTLLQKRMDESIMEYYYADHINAILGVYTELYEVTNLQCDYLELLEKYDCLETELSKSKMMSKSFEALQKPAINLKIDLQQWMYKLHTELTQTRKSQLSQDSRKTNKCVSFSTGVIPTTSASRPQLKSNSIGDRVMPNNSQGKKQDVEDNHRNVKFFKNKTSVTACNDSLKAKTLNVNCVCATCGKCVLNEKHDMYVLKSVNSVNSRTKMPIAVPVSTREPKCTVKQSDMKPIRKIVDSESNQKPRNITRKLYEHVRKACIWWYPKFTPSGYKWKPKSGKENVNLNVSMPLGNASRTANVMDPMTSRRSTVSNNPLSSNFFVARRDCPIHRAVTIKRVYYVEGMNHNLFSIGQFYDVDLEVAFRKSTCYIRDLKGNDLLTGTDTPYLRDGYGVLVFRTVIFKYLHLSSRMRAFC